MDYLVCKELYHHGIKGQKWGIRRFQNEDGSLNEEGKRKYYSNPNKLHKDRRKEVKRVRAKQSNWSNQWMTSNTIGPNSESAYKKELNEYNEKRKPIDKAWKKLDADYNSGKIDLDQYEQISSKLVKEDISLDYGFATVVGKRYSNEAMKHIGNINIGYIKDIGFNDDTASKLNEILNKSKKQKIY